MSYKSRGSKYERDLKDLLEELGFLAAISKASKGHWDVCAMKAETVFGGIDVPKVYAIEVKSTGDKTFYTTVGENKEQYVQIVRNARTYPWITWLYAVRFISGKKGKLWRIYDPLKEHIFRNTEGTNLEDL